MIIPTIIDAGPLVAYLDHRDSHHDWTKSKLVGLATPPLTCEAVVTEACFLLRRNIPGAERSLLRLLTSGQLVIAFDLGEETRTIATLMTRYANVPMSLADACLVRMAELHPDGRVLTLDGDFRIYRKNGRDPLDAILPEL